MGVPASVDTLSRQASINCATPTILILPHEKKHGITVRQCKHILIAVPQQLHGRAFKHKMLLIP
jgi:hypothetical protein